MSISTINSEDAATHVLELAKYKQRLLEAQIAYDGYERFLSYIKEEKEKAERVILSIFKDREELIRVLQLEIKFCKYTTVRQDISSEIRGVYKRERKEIPFSITNYTYFDCQLLEVNGQFYSYKPSSSISYTRLEFYLLCLENTY